MVTEVAINKSYSTGLYMVVDLELAPKGNEGFNAEAVMMESSVLAEAEEFVRALWESEEISRDMG